jgi:hypothetical protein
MPTRRLLASSAETAASGCARARRIALGKVQEKLIRADLVDMGKLDELLAAGPLKNQGRTWPLPRTTYL